MSHGNFVWYELMTTDAAAATDFYQGVVGWGAADAGMTEQPYTLLSVGGKAVSGLMTLPPEARAAGGRPGWIGYIAVDDVDAFAARVEGAGGRQHRPAADIPGVGRFAVMADPQGAVFVLFKGTMAEPPEPPVPGTPGCIGWHELHAADWQSAFGFYSGLFGWTKVRAIDMGPMGTYQLFAAGGPEVGGMMSNTPDVPRPYWIYYFIVDAIDAAIDRITAGGGQVIHGPMEVPGGNWVVNGRDPQGAVFALVAPHR